MEETMTLPFGRKIQVGNYLVVKTIRSLNRRELRELREQAGIPKDVQKHLDRGGLPYITVQTVSGSWSISIVCGMRAYDVVDRLLPCALEQQEEPKEGYEGTTVADLAHLFNMWYMDTTLMGDSIYRADRAAALKAYTDRIKALEETPESKAEDDRVLDEMKADDEARATIKDMSEHIGEGGDV